MSNRMYSEIDVRKDLKAGGANPPPTGPSAGPGGTVSERVRSYPDMTPHGPDRSNGVKRCKTYPQSKGL